MNIIAWFLCFTIICTILVHQVTAPFSENDDANKAEDITSSTNIQVKQEPPLTVMFYECNDMYMRTVFTDLTEAKKMDLKSLLDKREPKYIVLLCEDEPNPIFIQNSRRYYQYFTVKRIIRKIDPNMEYPTCESKMKRSMKINTDDFYDIDFVLSVTEDQLYNKGSESSPNKDDLYVSFMKEFRITETLHIQKGIFYLRIWYSVEYMMPTAIQHYVNPYIHFDDYDIKCENMDLEKIEFERRKTPVDIKATLSSAPDGFQWRQLVPMQDFKGIHTTKATCTYLNYVLLHNNIIESLQKVERFIRKIADVLQSDEVGITSGTYKTVDNSIPNSSDEIVRPIPEILWKKISLYDSGFNEYSVLIVIHNQQTPRICAGGKSIQELGWPGENGAIGTMYNCFIENNIVNTMNLKKYLLYKPEHIKPLYLFSEQVKTQWENFVIDVSNGTKQERPPLPLGESSK